MRVIRVAIADDHPIVLDGLEQLFRLEPDFALVARCRDGRETLRMVAAQTPDVLVLDVRMPQGDGLEVLRTLEREGAATRVVLLTAAVEDDQLLEALRLGARGVVLKEMAPQVLVSAVRAVAAGGEWLERGLGGRAARKLLEREQQRRDATDVLTAREIEVVRKVAAGKRNRAIANELFISEGTVKIHLHNVYDKLRCDGRLALVLWAKQHGLV
ncbi:MAG: response regulator transcription factor [Thermoanaerobaculia bacterium]|nr:response regulator transcription factor [Thermoanaerobaculia bacterium]